jgi:hypothetical protein
MANAVNPQAANEVDVSAIVSLLQKGIADYADYQHRIYKTDFVLPEIIQKDDAIFDSVKRTVRTTLEFSCDVLNLVQLSNTLESTLRSGGYSNVEFRWLTNEGKVQVSVSIPIQHITSHSASPPRPIPKSSMTWRGCCCRLWITTTVLAVGAAAIILKYFPHLAEEYAPKI